MASDTARETGAQHPAHLDPSELGTKEYWESFYSNSLAHLSSKKKSESKPESSDVDSDEYGSDEDDDNDSDPGTSWFSEYKAPEKVLQFLTSESFPLAPCNTTTTTSSTNDAKPTILDLGTGNGSILTLLRDKGGFNGKMVGVDYSERSVELARQLLAGRSASADIRFETWDILASVAPETEDWFPADEDGFDIVLDKGTFDAVSLSAEEMPVDGGQEEGSVVTDNKSGRVQRRICERYPAAATRLAKPGGFLIVTSCNWTEEELVKWFTAANADGESELSVWGKVEYVKFRFGGQEGQGVCTVCFQRRALTGDMLQNLQ